MPREPMLYYRRSQKRWVCTIDGTRVTLGTKWKTAKKKFDALMKDRTTTFQKYAVLAAHDGLALG